MSVSPPSEWDIPEFEEYAFKPRLNRYVLVIPVINEGERIQNQLLAIQVLGLELDVVVADGGSTDGSLQPEFLNSAGVNALLVKRGPGGLSAQLRVAYAWALVRRYEGIITMDGNGKDGVDGIPLFLRALQDGYDLIQGSRYASGGVAENTPLDRYFAGRLIHARLISIGARFRFSDTTNGFRAYSAQALRDPRVAPFRPVFKAYGLLFYLSVRIPQLGYRVCEVPVSRRYPAKCPTPTKIDGIRGRLAMMGELLDAVRGRLNP
jgi:glycosyltransferase involved in cell wall biosynthesis